MVTIRPHRTAELATVIERGLASSWDQLADRERPDALPATMAQQLHQMYGSVLATPGSRLLVAEWPGAQGLGGALNPGPAGHALLYPQSNPFTGALEVVVMDIFVHPSLRGHGLGGALLAEAEGYARALGATGIAAQIVLRNGASRALFTRQGFQPERLVVGRRLS